MKRQPPDDRKSEPAANDHQPISDRPDFESSIDLEDALMLAIFDSVVKPKRKKARGHFAQRRPKSPF